MTADIYVQPFVYDIYQVDLTAVAYTQANASYYEHPNFFSSEVQAWLDNYSRSYLDDSGISGSFLDGHIIDAETFFDPSVVGAMIGLATLESPVMLAWVEGLTYKSDWVILQPDKRYTYSKRNKVYMLFRDGTVAPGDTVSVYYIRPQGWEGILNGVRSQLPVGSSVVVKAINPIFLTVNRILERPALDLLNRWLAQKQTVTFEELTDAIRSFGGLAAITAMYIYSMCPGGEIRYFSSTSPITQAQYENVYCSEGKLLGWPYQIVLMPSYITLEV